MYSVALSCLFGIWIIPFLYLDHAFLGFGSCLFWDLVYVITEIEIVQEPVRKLKAETIDKALQQIREACDVFESDPNMY